MAKREATRAVIKASRLAGLSVLVAAVLASIRRRLGWDRTRTSDQPKPLTQLPSSAVDQSNLLPDHQNPGDENDVSIFAFTA